MKRSVNYTSLIILGFLFLFNHVKADVPAYSTEGYTNLTGSNKSIPTSGISKYLIPSGQSWSGGITVEKDQTLSLIIEGTASVSWVSLKKDANLEIIVGAAGAVNFTTFSNESLYTLTNYSESLTFSAIGGTVINYGTITGTSIHINSTALLENYGIINTTNLEVDLHLKNYGTINVAALLKVNNKATLENSCKILVKGNYTNDNILIMKENSYLEVLLTTTFYSKSSMVFEQNALLKTLDVWTWGHGVTGPATGHALFQYFGKLTAGSMPDLSSHNIYFADSQGKVDGEAISFSIPKTSCSPGFQLSKDADGDGIPDSQDEFPNDATRAFISYYPSDAGTWNTLMFEDEWPKLGDYDFNDLVIKYQYEYYSNADNEVVDLTAHFKVMASGADYANGFGFKLDIPNESVLNVEGYEHAASVELNANKTEKGSADEAVIIVYSNLAKSLGSMFNVTRAGETKDIGPISVHVSLNKVSQAQVTTVNPFIYIAQARGREVHMMGYSPTSKADDSYFGTENDNSPSGIYYRSSKGYPWSLNVPADVSHMIEMIDFTIGYPDFVKWAESDGMSYQDWYRTNLYTPVLY